MTGIAHSSICPPFRGHCYPAVSLNTACESRRKDLENVCTKYDLFLALINMSKHPTDTIINNVITTS